MIVDGCALHILAAGFGCEGGEEGNHCLYIWEVAVNLTVFEEVVQHHQQLPKENALLIPITLAWSFVTQRFHQLSEIQLMIAQHTVENARGYFGVKVGMRLADTFLLQDGQLDQRAGQLQLHSCVVSAGNAPLHTLKSTTSFRMASSLYSLGMPLYNSGKRECLPITTSNSSHRTASSFSSASNPATPEAKSEKDANSGSTWQRRVGRQGLWQPSCDSSWFIRLTTMVKQAAALAAAGEGVESRMERWNAVSSADTIISDRTCSSERAYSGSLYLLACRMASRQSTTSMAMGRAISVCSFCRRSGMTI